MSNANLNTNSTPNPDKHPRPRFHPFDSALATIALGIALTLALNVLLHGWMR